MIYFRENSSEYYIFCLRFHGSQKLKVKHSDVWFELICLQYVTFTIDKKCIFIGWKWNLTILVPVWFWQIVCFVQILTNTSRINVNSSTGWSQTSGNRRNRNRNRKKIEIEEITVADPGSRRSASTRGRGANLIFWSRTARKWRKLDPPLINIFYKNWNYIFLGWIAKKVTLRTLLHTVTMKYPSRPVIIQRNNLKFLQNCQISPSHAWK